MNKYRIVSRESEGIKIFLVQEKILWWWFDFKPTYVSSAGVGMYNQYGYFHIEGAYKQFEKLTGHKHCDSKGGI